MVQPATMRNNMRTIVIAAVAVTLLAGSTGARADTDCTQDKAWQDIRRGDTLVVKCKDDDGELVTYNMQPVFDKDGHAIGRVLVRPD